MIRYLVLIFACLLTVNRCNALDLQQQLMLQSAIVYLQTQFEDLTNATKLECKTALRETFQGVKSQEYWALKIVDSIPKIPAGILEGNIRDYGNFDECLAARNEELRIQGKYCLVNMVFTDKLTDDYIQNASKTFKTDVVDLSRFDVKMFNNTLMNFFGISKVLLSWGFCVPHACDGEDVTALFDYIIYGNFKEPIIRIVGNDDYCQTSDPEPIPLRTLLAMIGFSIVLIIAGASTTYDVMIYQKRNDGRPKFWISFSLLTNGRKLFLEKRQDSMSCLYGIRTIGCILVVISHVRQFNWLSPSINSIAGVNYDANFSLRSLILVGGPLTIDTFLLLSGMLLSYNFFKEAQTQSKKLSGIPAFYLHRIIRISPPLIAITVFYLSIFKWMVDGPAALPFKGYDEDSCHWWAPMIFISNFMPQCAAHTWYLAVDMQLFLISPIFLFTLLRKPTLGYALIALTFSISIGYTMYIFNMYRLSMTAADFFSTPADRYFTYNYLATHVRITPWLLGIAYGHFLHTKVSKRLLNPVTNIVGWCCAFSIFLFYMITHHSYSVNKEGMFVMSLYYGFNRPLWALAVAFISYSCIMGFGGLMNYIMSLDVFRILSNLSYSMYLTHVCAVMVVIWSRWTSSYVSDMRDFLDLCSTYTITLFGAIPFALCFEYPFIAMESYFKKRGKQLDLNKAMDINLTNIETLEKEN